MSFGRDIEEGFIDNGADRLINDIIPGNGTGLFGGAAQTGIDQFANNEINQDLFGGGLGSGGGYGGGGYGGGGYGGGGYGGGGGGIF